VSPVLVITLEEIREALRNRWFAGAMILFLVLAMVLALVGSAPIGEVRANALSVTVVSLASLSVYLVPLIALLISFDAAVGEQDRGTLLLLLTYPVSRWQILLGKYLGALLVLGIAILVGYGAAGAVLAFSADAVEGWRGYAGMMGSSWLLGAAFVGLGCLASVLVRQRATAVGLAVGIWLVMVVIYDLALLGLLLADKDLALSPNVFTILMTLNPTDAYRIVNLMGSEASGLVSGMGGAGRMAGVSLPILLGALVAWALVPLGAAVAVWRRREL